MAYGFYNGGNGYINPYLQQTVQPQPMQAQVQPQNRGDGIIWIQGEAAAKSYLVAPNSSVVLWDSENPFVYVKAADATGMPSMRKFAIKEVLDAPKAEVPPSDEFVSKKDFEALKGQFDSLSEQFAEMAKKSKKKEGANNE